MYLIANQIVEFVVLSLYCPSPKGKRQFTFYVTHDQHLILVNTHTQPFLLPYITCRSHDHSLKKYFTTKRAMPYNNVSASEYNYDIIS